MQKPTFEKEKTAVDVLVEKLPQIDWINDPYFSSLLNAVKHRERIQIEQAHKNGGKYKPPLSSKLAGEYYIDKFGEIK